MLSEKYEVARDDYANAGRVSSQVKQYLSSLGVSSDVLRRIAVACYEAEINMIIHAWGGAINLNVTDDGVIQLIFKDVGPGITDLEKALTPGWSTASEEARSFGFGAGMGLVNIKRVSDEFDIVSSEEGTTLTIGFKVS
ncbi:MAG: ATP-binding protein [Erysipelotrichaceae bacterium]|jgi:anti-sigma regulatory factor (Ser/Thr protein kinase)|nr:ATP-binding protein [Bacillota bacterium]